MKILDGPASATGSARGIAERITAGLDSVDHDRRRPRGGSPGGAAMTAFGWGRQRTDHTPFEGGARGLSGKRWIALCASAEAVGMTAAAVAAKLSQHVLGGQPRGWDAALALLLVVAGGLVEGAALGALQASGLRRLIPRLNRRRWLVVTAAVAGLGWAAASAPGVFSGDSGSDAEPALLVVVAAALGLGAVMGAVLGAAQAMTVRRLVPRPTRWVLANTIAWPPTMAVIFIGATTPESGWPTVAVAAFAAITGIAAGTVLGIVTGWFLPTLDGSVGENVELTGHRTGSGNGGELP
ncbi:hypothetical protein ACVH9Z_05215 [Rhodococcus opacus]|nr:MULTISPECIES: hypothetical protein [Rhodococcus]MDI9936287.1 hypothetical protein [Rhodococcus sp. IEGM 1351]MDJ0415603.1 hypothetical protein [Rhodococcus opacus]QZS59308.1 hypothetical protein FXW36_21085 [Rhodococcus opacus]RKM74112.1 hypothetical protein COO55_20000 [Rhodococcus opacus]UNM98807.1 hypothetical protein MOO23_24215 [Rhodococcus opacus]